MLVDSDNVDVIFQHKKRTVGRPVGAVTSGVVKKDKSWNITQHPMVLLVHCCFNFKRYFCPDQLSVM
jgi:hypothetical protein